ncbi:3-hydroxyisobutyryl-CoA hydrolase, mitochondrial-like [Saccoglossus kowalevskii]|uniref:3-hydroxyisobutyryl-CoA hydrolase, mitochondrial n=1 Tax=Saccoglossus kowalevskii TaxID=10224 RepID=A0ABM0GSA9_SACKO|nr:PREDICTED: 3-hydroxyisobutyryl-CoA hydrolase, mitochondrial-like [Saccoglossus kowalevskii]
MTLQALLNRSPLRRLSVVLQHVRSMSSAASQDDVILEKVKNTAVITMNRPKALNTLNLSMVRKIYPKLKEWESDGSTSLVIIKATGDKAFCAGGDIKAITDAARAGEPHGHNFFKEEYILNHAIGTLRIPYVALINGITMGGGVGLSVHGHFRVATQRTLFAMPETAVGLFPDVGGSYFLSRLGGNLGIYLALTGVRLKGRDVQRAGVATHFVETEQLGDLEKSLINLENANENKVLDVLDSYHNKCTLDADKEFSLKPHLEKIDRLFGGNTLEEIFENLEKDGSEWALKQLEILKRMSPTSMKVTLRQLREGAKMSFNDCFTMEFRICSGCLAGHDFYEGVRAVLVDKDNSPKWNPATINEVTSEIVDAHFKPLDSANELIIN